jgi:tRNA-uridine 2-sulfurtransferase
METVFLAMSGGLDSSFAAYLLKAQGYNVVGVTFQLLPSTMKSNRNPKACCSSETVQRARKVADHLSIPHYMMNLREEFQTNVMDRFVTEYRKGRTPNPCILCNQHIKFSAFAHKAFSLGADKIATGHYASIESSDGRYALKRGTDHTKDQTYFLYPIAKDLLASVLFPLGPCTKGIVRQQAYRAGWQAQDNVESQDICFVPEGNYRHFLSSLIPPKEGPVYLSTTKKRIGTHQGIHLFTVGQRRGLNIPFTEPLYVIEIRPDENAIVAGPKDGLGRTKVSVENINVLSPLQSGLTGRARYRQEEEPCTYVMNGSSMKVTFTRSLYSVTPGQSLVLYSGDEVVCGGVVTDSAP